MKEIIINSNREGEFKDKCKMYFLKIKKYLIGIYTKKHLIYKSVICLAMLIFVFGLSFGVREIVLNRTTSHGYFIKGFLDIHVVGNNGIAFSIGENINVHLINFIQLIPVIISIIALIFTKSYVIDVGLVMLIGGGLSNVIDRAVIDNYKNIYMSDLERINAVVDYIYFSFIPNSAIFNVPDVFVILGVITISIYSIIKIIIESLKNKNGVKNEQQN